MSELPCCLQLSRISAGARQLSTRLHYNGNRTGPPATGSQMLETVTISAATARNESQAEQRFSVPVRDLVTFLFANWK